jgi:hypothetical protein
VSDNRRVIDNGEIQEFIDAAAENGQTLTYDQVVEMVEQSKELQDKFATEQTARVAGTQHMVLIAAKAKALGLNQQLADAEIDSLLPDTNHVLIPWLIHDHADDKPVEAHMRVRAHLKSSLSVPITRAYERMIDVPMDLWNQLPTIEDVYATDEGARESRERNNAWNKGQRIFRQRLARETNRRAH